MNIFQTMTENLKHVPITLRFPQRLTSPVNFRGLVQFHPDGCVGCATCAYVCASKAIRVTATVARYEWAYDPGQCTFCGRCLEVCPGHALTMAAEPPPAYTQSGALRQRHSLAYQRCPECGQPAQPVNDMILARAFDEITAEVRAWSRLCEHCRQGRYQPALIETGYAARSEAYER